MDVAQNPPLSDIPEVLCCSTNIEGYHIQGSAWCHPREKYLMSIAMAFHCKEMQKKISVFVAIENMK